MERGGSKVRCLLQVQANIISTRKK